jgi:hypothetical protein
MAEAPLNKHTVIIPVQFAMKIEIEVSGHDEVKSFTGSFHPVRPLREGEENGDFESDVWRACLEEPTMLNGVEQDGPDYMDQAKERLAMELGRPLVYDGEQREGESDEAYAQRLKSTGSST